MSSYGDNARFIHSDFPTSLQISSTSALLMGALALWRSDSRLSIILVAGAFAVWYVLRNNVEYVIPTVNPSTTNVSAKNDALASHFLTKGAGGREDRDSSSKHTALQLRSELYRMISSLGVTRAMRLAACCPNRLKNAIDSANEFFRAADSVLVQRNKKRGKRKLCLHIQTLKDMRSGTLNAFHGMHFVLSNDKDIKFLHRVVNTLRMETLNTMIAVVSSFGGSLGGDYVTATPISNILGSALPLDNAYDGTEPF